MNEFAPFADRQQLYEDMFGAGVQNLFNASTMFEGQPMAPRNGRLSAPLTQLPSIAQGSVTSNLERPLAVPNRLTRPLAPLTPQQQRINPRRNLQPIFDALKMSFLGF